MSTLHEPPAALGTNSAAASAIRPTASHRPTGRSARRMRAIRRTAVAVSALVFATGLGLTAERVWANYIEVTETGTPGYLRLAAHAATPLDTTLSPGGEARWLIAASLADADTSTLELELTADGALVHAAGLSAEVATCSEPFTVAGAAVSCAGARAEVLAPTPLTSLRTSQSRYELADLDAAEHPREVLVTIRLPEAADPGLVARSTARIGIGFHATGDSASTPTPTPSPSPGPLPSGGNGPGVTPPARLPAAGSDVLPLALCTLGLIGIGGSLLLTRRRDAEEPA